jgi:hypothetical protein
LKTPEGWARANLLLAALQEPPPPGSLQESALMLLVLQLEQVEHEKFRALITTIIKPEKGAEAFDEYLNKAFPYIKGTEEKEKQQNINKLMKEIKRGVLVVKSMPDGKKSMKSRLKTRIIERTEKQKDDFYSKLGSVVPIR